MTSNRDITNNLSRDAQPADMRASIDQGQTGDKVAGFDPATVPMETDSEAGGTAAPVSREANGGSPSQTGAELPIRNASAHGDALRPFENARQPRREKSVMIYAGILAAVAIVFFGGLLLLR